MKSRQSSGRDVLLLWPFLAQTTLFSASRAALCCYLVCQVCPPVHPLPGCCGTSEALPAHDSGRSSVSGASQRRGQNPACSERPNDVLPTLVRERRGAGLGPQYPTQPLLWSWATCSDPDHWIPAPCGSGGRAVRRKRFPRLVVVSG